MRIEDVVSPAIIDLDMRAKNKHQALEHLTALLVQAGRVSEQAGFLHEVMKREETETTDLGFGVAIPHGMCTYVLEPSVAIGKLREPIKWGDKEEDEEPVFAIFLMATSPDEKGRSHIAVIAGVASLLIEEDFVAFLRENDDKVELLEEIKTYSGEA